MSSDINAIDESYVWDMRSLHISMGIAIQYRIFFLYNLGRGGLAITDCSAAGSMAVWDKSMGHNNHQIMSRLQKWESLESAADIYPYTFGAEKASFLNSIILPPLKLP